MQGNLAVDTAVDLETSQLKDSYMAVSDGLDDDRKDDRLAAAAVVAAVAADDQTLKISASCHVNSFFESLVVVCLQGFLQTITATLRASLRLRHEY